MPGPQPVSPALDTPGADCELQLLGEPRWRTARGEARLAPLDAALLALLAVGGEQPRNRVAAWLWPKSSAKNANLSLRQRLFKLRQAAGHPLVEAGTLLRLAPGVRAPLTGSGELLGGLDFGDLEAFDEWLGAERDKLALRRVDTWAGEAAQLEARGALAEALSLAERIVASRPALEHGWRRLMRLHYLRGDRAAAIDSFERFERLVCREQGLRPAAETLALLDTIERCQATAPAARGPLPAELLRPPRLVGRDASLAAMAAAWAGGRAVLVLAEGGLGKSRLLEEFLRGHTGSLLVRARPGDAGMPYGTLTPLIVQAYDRFAPELPADTLAELARLTPMFGAAPAGKARQALLWMAVETLLQRCTAHGLASIAIDDLHHADAASLELMQWLLASEALAPLRFVFASRPGEGEAAGRTVEAWLGDSQRVEPVRLAALKADEVAALVQSLNLPALPEPGRPLAEALYQHAGGHPFLTLETLKSLALGNQPVPGGLPLPAAASALIERRVQRLSGPARDLLRLVALADAGLRLEVAARVVGRPLFELAAAWSELQAAQLLQASGTLHDLVRESVRANLSAPARRSLRLALAQALSSQSGVPPLELAEHWIDCEAWPEAVQALRAAAQQARLTGRLLEYEQLLERAAEAAGRGADEAQRFDALCLTLATRMLRCGAASVLPRLAEELARGQAGGGTPAQRSRLLAMRCEAELNLGHAEPALRAGADALALAEDGSSEQFEAVMLYGRALALCGRIDEAIQALERAAGDAPRFPDPNRLIQAHAALAHALYIANRLQPAMAAQRRALEMAQQLGDATEIAHHMSNLAGIANQLGDVPLTYRTAAQAHRRFQAMGMFDGHFVMNAITLARCAAHLGRLDEAYDELTPLVTTNAHQVGSTLQVTGRVVMFGLRLWLGQRPFDDEDGVDLTGIDVATLLPVARAGLWLAQLRLRRDGATHRTALQALQELGRTQPVLRDNAMLYREWARWDEPAQALERLQRLSAHLREVGSHAAARSLELVQLDLLAATDRKTAATRALRLAAELPEGLLVNIYPPQAWWCLARAMHHGGEHSAAATCRERAMAWIDAAQLPAAADRAAYRANNPVNRAVCAGDWADPGW